MTPIFFTLATTPSNQQNQQICWPIMAHQVLKLLQQLNLFIKYLLLVTLQRM